MTTLQAYPGFSFGCDPELFIVNSDGEYVCAEGLIPGTKSDPYPVPGGAVQVDGMAAEFNIDPAQSYEEWETNITKVLASLKKMLPSGCKLMPVPAVTFSEKVWNDAPPQAKELGCVPDYNAWTGSMNPPPHSPDNPRLRTASGHIHIGWTDDVDVDDEDHINNCRDLVKQFDWYLGSWSLLKDTDPQRRLLYGKAGASRFKPYGVEYRVLSNFWVAKSSLRREVWNRMQVAIEDMRSGFLPEKAFSFNNTLIESINSSQIGQILSSTFKFPVNTINRMYSNF